MTSEMQDSSTNQPMLRVGDEASVSRTPRKSGGRTRRLVVVGIIALFCLAVFYGGASWVFADKLIGQQFPSQPEVTFADFSLPQPEDVTFTNGSTRLVGWYFANPKSTGCAMVMLHGFTSNKAQVLIAAPLFWNRGCDILTYDLRGHGQSSSGLLTFGVHDKVDELAAVDWLSQRTGLTDEHIGLMGWSYGAATSLQAAAARPDLAFVIADSSYSSLKDIANVQADQLFGSWAKIFVPGALLVARYRADFNPADASPEHAVQGLKTPVLLVHSTTDDFTPYQQSEKIYANSDQTHTTLVLTRWGALHAVSYGTDPVAYAKFVNQFMTNFAPTFGRPTP